MHWTYDDFVVILKSDVAKELLADAEVAALVASWKDVHKAALLHANGITAQSAVAEGKPLFQLVLLRLKQHAILGVRRAGRQAVQERVIIEVIFD